MNKTQSTIARGLRKRIGAGFWGRTELYADDLGDKLSALCRHARYSAYFYRGWLYFSGI